jgi:uncharacterized membrane protein YkoI
MTLLIAFRDVAINRFVVVPAPVEPALSVDEDVTTGPRPAAKTPTRPHFCTRRAGRQAVDQVGMEIAKMRAPDCWRPWLALALLSTLVGAPAHAIARSDGAAPAARNEASEGARDQEAIDREIERFRGATISLCDAMAIAEARHAGSTTADISFDGTQGTPVYRVKTLHNDRIWRHEVDAATGNIVGGEAAIPLTELDANDRNNLATLKTIRQRLPDAVRVAEHTTAGRAISGGLIRERGRLSFSIVVVSGTDLKEVVLEPPGARGR